MIPYQLQLRHWLAKYVNPTTVNLNIFLKCFFLISFYHILYIQSDRQTFVCDSVLIFTLILSKFCVALVIKYIVIRKMCFLGLLNPYNCIVCFDFRIDLVLVVICIYSLWNWSLKEHLMCHSNSYKCIFII